MKRLGVENVWPTELTILPMELLGFYFLCVGLRGGWRLPAERAAGRRSPEGTLARVEKVVGCNGHALEMEVGSGARKRECLPFDVFLHSFP